MPRTQQEEKHTNNKHATASFDYPQQTAPRAPLKDLRSDSFNSPKTTIQIQILEKGMWLGSDMAECEILIFIEAFINTLSYYCYEMFAD